MKAHFILFVRDPAASKRFYAAVLGREPDLDVPGMTEFHLPGGAVLGLMPETGIRRLLGDGVEIGGTRARAELYLVDADAAQMNARALAAGAELVSDRVERSWGATVGYVRDPDGHLLAFADEP